MKANTWFGISEEIKTFFKEYVAKDFYLQLQDTEDEVQFRVPYVDLQTLPHKNFIQPDLIQYQSKAYQAPYILIETQNVRVSNNEVTLGVRVIFGVYASGKYATENSSLNVPDNKAYIDLMLIMQKALEAINTKKVFGNAQLAEGSEIVADIYDMEVPTYPYAYGNITFDVQYYTSNAELNL